MSVLGASAASAPPKAMHIGLWVAQVLLALAFGMAGTMKTFTPIDELVKSMPWFTSVPFLPRFIGRAEFAGALGMILPAATRIRPALTPLAGVGLSIIMILAAGMHLLRGELQMVPINVLLGGLAVFVVWGRLRKVPIEARP